MERWGHHCLHIIAQHGASFSASLSPAQVAVHSSCVFAVNMGCFFDHIPNAVTLRYAFPLVLVTLFSSTGHTGTMQYILIYLNIFQNLEQEKGKVIFEKITHRFRICALFVNLCGCSRVCLLGA